MTPPHRPFVFLDEGGNLDFSDKGTKYFTFTALTVTRPFQWESALAEVKYDALEAGLDIEYFHATESKQVTRDRVFAAIVSHLPRIRIDSLVVEKRKTRPPLQLDAAFYPRMLAYLLRHVFKHIAAQQPELITVMTDTIPNNKRRDAIAKEVKTTLRNDPSKHRLSNTPSCLEIVPHVAGRRLLQLGNLSQVGQWRHAQL